MKKILTILFLLVGYFSFAQQSPGNDTTKYIWYKFQYGSKMDRYEAIKVLNPPNDTTYSKTGIARKGNSFFVGNGSYWTSVSSNIFLSAGVDSVTLRYNILCQWIGGISTCWTLASNNCASALLSGSVLIDSLFVGHNTNLVYQINCVTYSIAASSFPITPAHATNDRYTIVYADTLGNIGTQNGTYNPANIPAINDQSQILLALYLIPGGSTTPYLISNTAIYKEAIEWLFLRGSISSGADSAYTVFPYAGLVSTRIPQVINGEYFEFQDLVTGDANSNQFISFQLRLGAVFDQNTKLSLSLYNNNSLVTSNSVIINNGTYGFNRTVSGSYQFIAVPFSAFNFISTTFDKVRFTLLGTNASGFQIDNIVIQSGGGNVNNQTGVITYNGRDGNVLPRRTDNTWSFDSITVSSDSLQYFLWNNGVLKDSVSTLLKPLKGDTCILISRVGDSLHFTYNPNCGGTGGGIDTSKWTLSGSNIYNKNSGNVGINDATPSEKLDVDGSINISSGSAYKYNSVNVIRAQTSLENYFFGNSGNLTSTGTHNIAMGNGALGSIVDAYNNVAIGRLSMSANLTGNTNTAVGANSLVNNTTGSSNTAFGQSSLFANTIGLENTALGRRALPIIVDGNNNVGVGAEAGGFTTTGNNNIFIGSYAGNRATTQSDQIFINSITRTNYLGDTTESPIYVRQNATVANQIIKLNGQLHFPLGAGASKVLTSDASGYATWQTPSGGGVLSVTGLNTNNTDPANPIVQISVDGTTIGGDGTPGSPLFAPATTTFYNGDGSLTGGAFGGFRLVDLNGKKLQFNGLTGGAVAIGDGLFEANLIGNYPFFGMTNQGANRYGYIGDLTNQYDSTLLKVDDAGKKITINADTIHLDNFGVGARIGTPTYGLGVNANGNLIETSLGGSGTVTNIATGLGLSGGPITTTGTISWDSSSSVALSRQRAAATYLMQDGTTPLTANWNKGAFSTTFTKTGATAATIYDAFYATNTTTASSGNQMYGGAYHSTGQGWKTTATAASQAVDYRWLTVPIQSTTNPIANWVLESSVNAGAYTRQLAVKSDGQIGVGSHVTLATDAYYAYLGANADFGGQLIITSAGTQSTVKSFFSGELILSGAGAFTAVRGINNTISNQGTSISNIIRGGYFSTRNSSAASRANTLLGLVGNVTASSTGGTIATFTGVSGELTASGVGGTITKAYAFKAEPLTNAGTITDTYSFFADDITTGTQTNTGYNFYGSDANALNYFAGSTGIGTVPAASAILDISSTTKGLLLPRMTKTQRDAISSPAAGLAVYQTDNTPGLRVYNGTNWMRYTETID